MMSRRQSFIYVIEAKSGVCKIGCSYNPKSRADMVYLHSPIAVRLIAVWQGAQKDERELHLRFADHREHSEWFRIEGNLASFIAEISGLNVEVPDWSEVSWKSRDARNAVSAERRQRQSMLMKQCWATRTPAERAEWVAKLRRSKSSTRPAGSAA